MSVSATVSIDRTSLGLAPLTISGDGSGTYSLTQGGLGSPVQSARLLYMPDHPDVHGSELLGAVRETTALPLTILVQAATSAALSAAVDALNDALWQFTYATTVTVDGVARTWTCHPCLAAPASGLVEHGMADQFFDVLSVTIPVYPIAS